MSSFFFIFLHVGKFDASFSVSLSLQHCCLLSRSSLLNLGRHCCCSVPCKSRDSSPSLHSISPLFSLLPSLLLLLLPPPPLPLPTLPDVGVICLGGVQAPPQERGRNGLPDLPSGPHLGLQEIPGCREVPPACHHHSTVRSPPPLLNCHSCHFLPGSGPD